MGDQFKICDNCSNSNEYCFCDKCAKCDEILIVPYIECTQCKNVNICRKCFASGCEFDTHENNHNYRVIRHDLEIFPMSTWTAAEELVLLNILSTYGYGNWELVREQLQNRTVREIKEHYDTYYLNKPVFSELPRVPETKQSLFPQILVPYRFKVNNVEEPPRYGLGTFGYNSVAGYNAPRSDFETEFNATAEQTLVSLNDCDIEPDDPHYDLFNEYICGIVRIYNRHLRERHRRKEIIRNHGLILMRKTNSWMHRYVRTLTRQRTERLMSFMQFFDGEGFELFMEGLHRATELKQRIIKLIEYRKKGITTLQAAEVYEAINREKEHHEKDLQIFVSNPRLKIYSVEEIFNKPQNSTNKRAQFRPLDVIGLPGFEKLSKQEQELCKTVRLVPETYLDLKGLLVAENKKLGYLHLKTARKMLKIDVNKTRKLYDFLINEGFINKPTD